MGRQHPLPPRVPFVTPWHLQVLPRRAGMGQAGGGWQMGWGCGLVQVGRADMGNPIPLSLCPWHCQQHGLGTVASPCSLPQSSFTLPSPALLPSLQIPAPRAPSFPHPSVFGNFPIFTPSNGPGHPESCLGDVLTSPSPTSLARLVLSHQGSNCHPWELPEPQGPLPASHGSLCSRGRAAGDTQRCPWGPGAAAATTPQCHLQ